MLQPWGWVDPINSTSREVRDTVLETLKSTAVFLVCPGNMWQLDHIRLILMRPRGWLPPTHAKWQTDIADCFPPSPILRKYDFNERWWADLKKIRVNLRLCHSPNGRKRCHLGWYRAVSQLSGCVLVEVLVWPQ